VQTKLNDSPLALKDNTQGSSAKSQKCKNIPEGTKPQKYQGLTQNCEIVKMFQKE
jgi:hypothetical protein